MPDQLTPRFGVIFDQDGNVLDAGAARKADEGYIIDTNRAEQHETVSLNDVKRISTTDLYVLAGSPAARYCYWTPMGWKCG